MKLVAMILLLSMAAFAVTVEPLPPSGYADTEVSTNMAFVVERPAMTRIEFTVALDATPTNNVEVAIGTDANSDGAVRIENVKLKMENGGDRGERKCCSGKEHVLRRSCCEALSASI